jgi:N-acyl-D-amino-acid deacylase
MGQLMKYDLVIRNGTVVDGSGRPRFRGDVGVVGQQIATIGRIRDEGKVEIDAEGHFVTPGFIDGHTHMDAQVGWDPLGTCSSWQGVTSVVMGNCGFGLAPCRESDREVMLSILERSEDISHDAMIAGIKWDWETFPQYLDALERLPKGINYAAYVGHSPLRTYVMGERSFEATATDDDIVAMRRELAAALSAGAIGFATGRSPNHLTTDGRPVPSRLASWSEVQALANVMTDLGAGILEIANEQHAEPGLQREYFDRLRDLAVDSGRLLTFIVFAAAKDPSSAGRFLALLDEIAEAGGRAVGQAHAREFMSVTGFSVQLPFDKLPAWRELRSLPLEAQKDALRDPARRAHLVDEALHGPYGEAIGAEARAPSYDMMRVFDAPLGRNRTVAELADQRGVSPVDVIIDLSLETNFGQLFAQPFANLDLKDVREMIDHPHTVVAISDSGAHVSQIIDASVPTFLLAHWVRREEALTWEEGVRKITFDPAMVWGFHDRGLLAVGNKADIVVLDPQRISPGMPVAANDLPAGALRLTQKADGILATIVNGGVLMRDNEHTGALPGQVLRGPLAS